MADDARTSEQNGAQGVAQIETILRRQRGSEGAAIIVSIIVILVFIGLAAYSIPRLQTLVEDEMSPGKVRELTIAWVLDRYPDAMAQAEVVVRAKYADALDLILDKGKEQITAGREEVQKRLEKAVDNLVEQIGSRIDEAVDKTVAQCRQHLEQLPENVRSDDAAVRKQLVEDWKGTLEVVLTEEVDPKVARFVGICDDINDKLVTLRDTPDAQLSTQQRLQKELITLWIYMARTQHSTTEKVSS